MDTPKLVKVSKEVFKDIFNSVKKSITNPTTEAKPLPPIRKRIVKKSVDPSFTKKEKALIALTDAEQSMASPKTLSTKEEKHLNVMSNVIINSIKKSKKGKTMLALTDAKPSMNVRKTIFKKTRKNYQGN